MNVSTLWRTAKYQASPNNAEKSGIGLQNVKRRLELSYPNQYKIKINDNPDVYFVQLDLTLSDQYTIHMNDRQSTAGDLQQTGTV